jgi:hypothetical protein
MNRTAIKRDLKELRRTALEEATVPQALQAPDDAVPLAGQLSSSFGDLVKTYHHTFKMSLQEAAAQVGASDAAQDERVLHGPPDQVHWADLHNLAQRDPDLARRRWEEVKQAARAELQSGFRAGRVMECSSDCWDRARFIAIRDDLAEGLRLRNGLEWQLIDMMAQAQTQIFGWQETLTAMSRLIGSRCQRALNEGGPYEAPRLSDDQMTERAMSMIERWHGIYTRTLKALQDHRRGASPVVVRRAGQVNIAAQQLNVGG